MCVRETGRHRNRGVERGREQKDEVKREKGWQQETEGGRRSREKGKGELRDTLWHSSLSFGRHGDSCFSVLVLQGCLAEQSGYKDWDLCSK